MSAKERTHWDLLFLLRALIAFLICAAALLLSAAVLYASGAASLSTLGYASSAVSFFSGVGAGAAAALGRKKGRFLIGFTAGLALSALLLLIGFLIKGALNGSSVLSVVSFTLSGCIVGSMLSIKRRQPARFRPVKRGK